MGLSAGDGLGIFRQLNQCESAGVGEKRLWLTGLAPAGLKLTSASAVSSTPLCHGSAEAADSQPGKCR